MALTIGVVRIVVAAELDFARPWPALSFRARTEPATRAVFTVAERGGVVQPTEAAR